MGCTVWSVKLCGVVCKVPSVGCGVYSVECGAPSGQSV